LCRGITVYPFERFTERAKKVLTLAQEEAERSHHSYIGTEHLLLGLLREREGLAAHVLDNLGVQLDVVRTVIESVLGRNAKIAIQQIIPTSRVKRVIELSFEESRRMGRNYVDTEHILLGLLMEGEGIAAHVLQDLGATVEKVRAEIERLDATESKGRPQLKTAAAEHDRGVGMFGKQETEVVRLLAEGLSNEEIGERLSVSARTVNRHIRSILNKLGPPTFRVGQRVLVHDPDPPHRLWEGRVTMAKGKRYEVSIPGHTGHEVVKAQERLMHPIPMTSTLDCLFCRA
jgi:ATP-dependent Clp protease ATP-binding subunit ClpA